MESAPLLGPGRHNMGLTALREVTVTAFPSSSQRPLLFTALESLAAYLSGLGLPCELWVDGSFLTERIEPNDVDVACVIPAEPFETLDVFLQVSVIKLLNGKQKFDPLLDTYLAMRFDLSDPRYSSDSTRYWSEFWSLDRDNALKGYACVRIGYSDVQLRLPS